MIIVSRIGLSVLCLSVQESFGTYEPLLSVDAAVNDGIITMTTMTMERRYVRTVE